MVFSVVFLISMKRFGIIPLVDFDWNMAKLVAPLAFFFNGMVFSGLMPLYYVNVPIYGALRRITTFLVIIGERLFLGRTTPTDEVLSVIFMVLGATIAGLGDIDFSMFGYTLVMLNCLITALYLVYIAKTTAETKLDTFGLMFYNSLLSIPVVVLCVLLFESDVIYYPDVFDYGFQICFLMSSVLAFLLNYFIFLCFTINSPLTTSITGQLKNIFTTIIGLFLFHDVKLTWTLIGGLFLSTLASIWYAWIKYQQKNLRDKEREKEKDSLP